MLTTVNARSPFVPPFLNFFCLLPFSILPKECKCLGIPMVLHLVYTPPIVYHDDCYIMLIEKEVATVGWITLPYDVVTPFVLLGWPQDSQH